MTKYGSIDSRMLKQWGEQNMADPHSSTEPSPVAAAGVHNNVDSDRIASGAQEALADPVAFYQHHKQGVEGAGAAALLVDGAVGLGSEREGFFGGVKGIVVGIALVVLGLVLHTTAGDAHLSARASGTVTSLTVTSDGSGQKECTADVSFSVGATSFTAQSTDSANPCPYHQGEPVEIAYDAANPADSMIVATGWNAWMPWILMGLGAVVLLSSLFTTIRAGTELGAGGFLLYRVWQRRRKRGDEPHDRASS